MNSFKSLALGSALLATTLASSVVLANSATPAGFILSGAGTVGSWITTGYNTGGGAATPNVVIDQDKIWTLLSADPSFTAGTAIAMSTFVDNPGPTIDTHQLVVGGNNTLPQVAWTGVLTYTIKVDTALSPVNILRNAAIGADVPGLNSGVTVTNKYYSDATFTTLLDTLVSIGGSSASTNAVFGLQQVWVEQTYNVTGSGILNSYSNTYTELTVPEPASLTLLSFGIVGLGMRARARKNAKKA